MSVTAETNGADIEDGVCLVPVKVLLDVLKNSRGDTVHCVVKDGSLYVSGGGGKQTSKTVITLLPSDDFPSIPVHTTDITHSLPAHVFIQGFQSVLFSVSPSTIKPELACISVQQKDGVVVFAATDSFRLAEKKVPYQGDEDIPPLLIPGKLAQELVYFLGLFEQSDVLWYFDEKLLAVRVGDYYVTTRLVQGTFPDYTKILPKEFTTRAQFITTDLQYVFKKANVFSDITKQISIELVPERNECLFRAKNTTVGEFEESIPARITGESLGLNFNSKYINDCLQYIQEEGVECAFAGPARPLVMSGVQ
jgi:DNA polymerase-3 subunit beta